MISRQISIFWLLLLLTQTIAAESISGRPSRIISGDKLVLTTSDNQHIDIQLLGIQAPPLKSRWGRAARKQLSSLIAGRPVAVEYQIRNRWGHPLGKVFLGGSDVSLRLLEAGLATHKPDFQTLRDNSLYSKAVHKAKRLRLGIWGGVR
ncbi:MAG: thermonuclease family protein [Gammaproteobacteria bacterium]|nr:thermonuclease family protein [Gammaproteobacteria bacterium]